MVLRTRGLTRQFGGLSAVENINFQLGEELCAMIGPNGAGKTTFFNLLTGFVEPTSGEIELLRGEEPIDITDSRPEKISSLGVHRSYQVTNLFPSSTVLENVRVAAQRNQARNFWRNILSFDEHYEEAHEILEFVGLDEYAEREASKLSHAEKRRLEMAIALAGDPEVLLLDEPTAGVSSEAVGEMKQLIRKVADDYPVMFIEHNMDLVMDISDRVVVLSRGRIVADGPPDEVQDSEEAQEAYLGGYGMGSSSTTEERGGTGGII